MRRAGAGDSRRSACAVDSRYRSLRSLVLKTIGTFARHKFMQTKIKSFAQAFSKACGFQRQSLWRRRAGAGDSRCRSLRSLVLKQ